MRAAPRTRDTCAPHATPSVAIGCARLLDEDEDEDDDDDDDDDDDEKKPEAEKPEGEKA